MCSFTVVYPKTSREESVICPKIYTYKDPQSLIGKAWFRQNLEAFILLIGLDF